MTQFEGIIFDKDGTLFDFAATWEAWAESFLLRLCKGDRARATQVGQMIGFDLETCHFAPDSIAIAGTPEEIVAVISPVVPEHTAAALLLMIGEESSVAPQIEATPLAAFFDDLKARGLKIGVATNDTESSALAHLQTAGVEQRFDFVVGFDSGYGAKPAPGQLLAFCKQTGCAAEHVIMVGDSTHDLIAGAAAGMTCIGVLTGVADRETLESHAEVVLNSIAEIPGWLDKQ